MVKVERVRLVNPSRKRKGGATRKRRSGAKKAAGSKRRHGVRSRKNPAELLSLGFTNPTRSRSHMAKAKRKRKGRSGAARRHTNAHRRSRKSNPFGARRHSRRRNPGMFSGAGSILKDGFYALLGLVAARQLPQLVLGARNTGWIGYAANLFTTLVAAMVGAKTLGAEAGKMIGVGGGVYTVNRVVQDQMSPIGQVLSLAGLGDYTALGDIQPGYFPLPVPTDAAGRPIIPAELQPPPPSMVSKGMGSVASSTRYASRF